MTIPDGVPNDLRELLELGYVSTTTLATTLGLPGLSTSWIASNFGIFPHRPVRNGSVVYWAPEQVDEIRAALIERLLSGFNPKTVQDARREKWRERFVRFAA